MNHDAQQIAAELRLRAGKAGFDPVGIAPARSSPHRDFLRNGEIVNRREMKNARGFSLEQFEIDVTQRETRHTDVAFDDLKVAQAPASELSDTLDLFKRARHE